VARARADHVASIKKAQVVLMCRGADPIQLKKEPIRAIIPNPLAVSLHRGPDVNTVMAEWKARIALLLPTTLMHEHYVMNEVHAASL